MQGCGCQVASLTTVVKVRLIKVRFEQRFEKLGEWPSRWLKAELSRQRQPPEQRSRGESVPDVLKEMPGSKCGSLE